MDIATFIPDRDIEMLTYISRPFFICDKSGSISCVFGNIDTGIRAVLRKSNFKELLCKSEMEKFNEFNRTGSNFCSFDIKGVGVYNTALAVHSYEKYPELFNVLLFSVSFSISQFVVNILHRLECSVSKELKDIVQSGINFNISDDISESGYRREGENVLYTYNRALLSYLYLSYPGFYCENKEIFCICDAIALIVRRIRAVKSFSDIIIDISGIRPTDMLYCDMTAFTLVITAVIKMLIDVSNDRVLKIVSEKSTNTLRIETNAQDLHFVARNITLDNSIVSNSSVAENVGEEKCMLFKDVPELKTCIGFIMNILSMTGGSISYSRTSPNGMLEFSVKFSDSEVPFVFENSHRNCNAQLDEIIPLLFA